ncbi:LacI family DNA-binding transcriptional regulator [Brachybacterium alimentarium]|uniref:LacI family DNA-binding transcriptional regulator n=1 Tax=Brachybacterium alimentarium TaxID=47845 RepID=UPI00360C3C26
MTDAREGTEGVVPRQVTMADVAARVGVSRQLVSLAFRDQRGVSAETKRRIFDAARALDYSPNTAARLLRSSSTKSIGVVFNPAESAPLDIIDCLHQTARSAGYTIVVSTSTPAHVERDAIRELVSYRCEALVLISPRGDADDIRDAAGSTPVVVFGRNVQNDAFDVVRSRGQEGIAAIVGHLVELGHSDIAYLHGPEMLDAESRRMGYTSSMRRLELEERMVEVRDEYTEESGASAARRLLAEGTLPTAVVCSNDQAAFGLMQALRQSGVRVPDDVSVTGYDDSRLAQLSFIDLTTARQDPKEVAAAVVEMALFRINGSTDPARRSFTSAPLIVRGSTAPPPG